MDKKLKTAGVLNSLLSTWMLTTNGIIAIVANHPILGALSLLAAAITLNDAVKFYKYQPVEVKVNKESK